MDRLRELEVFTEIAAVGSLAEAGRRLNLSPPAVTRILAGLEERLGVRLVQRTTRSLSLTEAGLRFRDSAHRLLADMDEAEREAAGAGVVPQGRVAITASTSFGRLAVVPVFAEFLNANPRVRGCVHLWDRNVNLIEEGIDVAVRIGDLPDSGLFARRLGVVRNMLVASPDYLARAGVPAHPDDLARHQIIAFRGVMPTDRIALKGITRTVSPWIELNDALSAISLAEAGHGLTVSLSYLTRKLVTQGRLVEVFPEIAPPERPVHLVWPEARLPTLAVRSFLDHAQPKLSAVLG
ncbi:MAG: LysR family transcriptional regulator [Dinoroseobacter sp.]|nr:LysR family transcriptional regulator [Dinoroseobacter sp.]MDJ0992659.1 LysR family transcriptional regulator [Dinoroseobacter sp.]